MAEAPWRNIDDTLLDRARAVPSMITPEEQKLYYWLTNQVLHDNGAIVDLGCFLGGSTACLAAGASERGGTAMLHAYDNFTAGERQKRKHLYSRGIAKFEGNDVFELALDYLSPWADRIELHRGDILDIGWRGGPIELLIFDAGKQPASADAMAELFFPSLIPGRSILVQQDYQLDNHPWLICQIEMLANYLMPLGCTHKNSAIFQVTRAITPRAVKRAKTESLSDSQMIRLMERAKTKYTKFGLSSAISKAIEALHLNPGKRRPRHFVNPPISLINGSGDEERP